MTKTRFILLLAFLLCFILTISGQARGSKKEADELKEKGLEAYYRGDFREALGYYQQALAISSLLWFCSGFYYTLTNIGLVYHNLGEYEKALGYYQQALAIAREIGNKGGEGTSLDNIGVVYENLGEYEKALGYYQQALAIRREIEDRSGEDNTLNHIGVVYSNLGEYEKALGYHQQALAIAREIGNRRGEGMDLNSIGVVYKNLGEYEKALQYYQQSLEIAQEIGVRRGEGNTFTSIGVVYRNLGEYEKALQYYQQALEVLAKVEIGAPEPLWRAQYGKGTSLEGLGREKEARESYIQAIETIETMRGKLKVEEHKTIFLEDKLFVYEALINLLLKMKQEEEDKDHGIEAFHYVERKRARALLDLLTEAKADIREGIADELREREKELLARVSWIQTRARTEEISEEERNKLSQELREIDEKFEELQDEIRASNPRYAELEYPEPYTLSQVQGMLDEDTILLEYHLGREKSAVWVITKDESEVYSDLPASRELTEQVMRYRRLLFLEKMKEDEKQECFHLGSLLYQKLILPLKDKLAPDKRLLIIPDGILYYLPFETLLAYEGDIEEAEVPERSEDFPYLLKDYSIFYSSSASVLGTIREEEIGRAEERVGKTQGQFLGFGDPVYPEVKKGERGVWEEVYLRSGGELGRLIYSGKEVMDVEEIYKSQARAYLRGEATEERVKSEELDNYRIVHFATHGFVDEEKPELSCVVLAIDEDPAEDGFLQLREVFNLKLDADLVTLSACQSGLGKMVRGEGLVGLTRGFMYAGTSSLLVSLWSVYDKSTAELMRKFYTYYREGMTKIEALRSAKLDMVREGIYSSPAKWAPFVLMGEWK